MNGNLNMGMMEYGMDTASMMQGGDLNAGFMKQLQDGSKEMVEMDATDYDHDLAMKAQNRNRGNYRCSKCGEPKKGHVCPLVPSNYKCNRCGLTKKSCSCSAPTTRSIGVQAEMDEDMTTRVLDLSVQGIMENPKIIEGFRSPRKNS